MRLSAIKFRFFTSYRNYVPSLPQFFIHFRIPTQSSHMPKIKNSVKSIIIVCRSPRITRNKPKGRARAHPIAQLLRTSGLFAMPPQFRMARRRPTRRTKSALGTCIHVLTERARVYTVPAIPAPMEIEWIANRRAAQMLFLRRLCIGAVAQCQ